MFMLFNRLVSETLRITFSRKIMILLCYDSLREGTNQGRVGLGWRAGNRQGYNVFVLISVASVGILERLNVRGTIRKSS